MNEGSVMSEQGKRQVMLKWGIVILSTVALGMSVWLSVQKFSGGIDSLSGCGAGSGCANVLGSEWSVVFQVIPVSVFSSLLYAGVLMSMGCGCKLKVWFQIFAACLIFGAAVWFTVLQLFVLRMICPYCMVVHSVGVLLAVLLVVEQRNCGYSAMRYCRIGMLCFALVLGLAAVQHWGEPPETHRVDVGFAGPGAEGVDDHSAGDVAHVHRRGEGKMQMFFEGEKAYRLSALPHLGGDDAPFVIVKYYDYTCSACRDMHGDLSQIRSRYPGELAVILLVVPLERTCNQHLPAGLRGHANACAYARLSIRVWLADATKFADFHSWMFEYQGQPVEIAEAMAYSMVGETKMEAVREEQIDELLAANLADYGDLVKQTPVMPKLLLKESFILQGAPRSVDALEDMLKEHVGLAR